MMRTGDVLLSALYIGVSVVVGVLAVYAGMHWAEMME
jgi:fluoride ion exporter CrcB/FEX